MTDQDLYTIVDLEGDWDISIEPEEFCQECGEPLAEGDEVVCPCGATYTREITKPK